MGYLGNTPTTQNFISGTDYFNGDGSTTAFTLSRTVNSVNDIEAVINNVVQQPNTAYTLSGTTITFTSAPSAGTSNIYVRYLSTTTQVITPSQNTVSYSTMNTDMQNLFGQSFTNRIINGAMMIDQRNAGASVTLTAANFVYPVDRMFAFRASGTSGAIAEQVLSGITPNGTSLRVQRNSGDTATATLGFGQVIESNNCIDLASQSITMSFKARCGANFSAASSQITARIGTGNGTDQSAANFYNLAWTGQSNTNTSITLTTSWQTFSVTISAGSSVSQVGAMFFYTPSGTASTNDWFEITDLQIEKGSTATSFDYRPYGTELALCQRYYENGQWNTIFPAPVTTTTQLVRTFTPFFVEKRANPTITFNDGNGNSSRIYYNAANKVASLQSAVTRYFQLQSTDSATLSYGDVTYNWTASAEL